MSQFSAQIASTAATTSSNTSLNSTETIPVEVSTASIFSPPSNSSCAKTSSTACTSMMFAAAGLPPGMPERSQLLPPFYQPINYMGLSPHSQMAAAAAEMLKAAQNHQSAAAAAAVASVTSRAPHFPPFFFSPAAMSSAAAARAALVDGHHSFYSARPPQHPGDFSLLSNQSSPSGGAHSQLKLSPLHKAPFPAGFPSVSQGGMLLSSGTPNHPTSALHPPAPPHYSLPFGMRVTNPVHAPFMSAEHGMLLPLTSRCQQLNSTSETPVASFKRGSLVRVGRGAVRTVEDLSLADFEASIEDQTWAMASSAADDMSSMKTRRSDGVAKCGRVAYKLKQSRLLLLEENHTNEMVRYSFSVGKHEKKRFIELPLAHPFFVISRGWCAAEPSKTRDLYGLDCQRLQVGDVCVSLVRRRSALQRRKQQSRASGPLSLSPARWRQRNSPPSRSSPVFPLNSQLTQQQPTDLSTAGSSSAAATTLVPSSSCKNNNYYKNNNNNIVSAVNSTAAHSRK